MYVNMYTYDYAFLNVFIGLEWYFLQLCNETEKSRHFDLTWKLSGLCGFSFVLQCLPDSVEQAERSSWSLIV